MHINKDGYTEKEIKLISMFGYAHLATHIKIPHSLFRMCVEKCFLENMQGSHVEALRKACLALNKSKPHRHTEEFEKLLDF